MLGSLEFHKCYNQRREVWYSSTDEMNQPRVWQFERTREFFCSANVYKILFTRYRCFAGKKIIHHRSGSLNIHPASLIDKLEARESKSPGFLNAPKDRSHRSCYITIDCFSRIGYNSSFGQRNEYSIQCNHNLPRHY